MHHERSTHDARRPNHPQYFPGQPPFADGNGQPWPHVEEFTPDTDMVFGPHATDAYAGPLAPPDTDWDPAAELAFMLQGTHERRQPTDFHEPETSPQSPADGAPQGDPYPATAPLGRRRRIGRAHV